MGLLIAGCGSEATAVSSVSVARAGLVTSSTLTPAPTTPAPSATANVTPRVAATSAPAIIPSVTLNASVAGQAQPDFTTSTGGASGPRPAPTLVPTVPGSAPQANVAGATAPQANPAAAPTFAPGNQPPSEPLNVTASAGFQSVTVSWGTPASPGSGPITGYTVLINDLLVQKAQNTLNVGVTNSVTQTNLINGRNYTATVSAVNAFGSSPPATSNQVSPNGTPTVSPSAPPAPTNVNATSPAGPCSSNNTSCVSVGSGTGSLNVTWNEPSSTQPVTNYTVRITPGGDHFTVNGTFISIQQLSAGTAYQVSVTANNSSGSSAATASNTVTVR